ncbi:MAG TPA: hypothetical protein VII56_18945 [Rhizomicrobium sp.]
MADDKIRHDADDRFEPLKLAGQMPQPGNATANSEPAPRAAPGRMPLFRGRLSPQPRPATTRVVRD